MVVKWSVSRCGKIKKVVIFIYLFNTTAVALVVVLFFFPLAVHASATHFLAISSFFFFLKLGFSVIRWCRKHVNVVHSTKKSQLRSLCVCSCCASLRVFFFFCFIAVDYFPFALLRMYEYRRFYSPDRRCIGCEKLSCTFTVEGRREK